MASLIMFDIGGVVIDYSEDDYIRQVKEDSGVPYLEYRRALAPLVKKLEVGKLTTERMESILAKRFSISRYTVGYNRNYALLARPNKKVIGLVNRLHGKYKVVLLSNISKHRLTLFNRIYGSMLHVDRIFASAYMGMRKPDPGIYKLAVSAMKTDPRDAVFVDNMIENVVGARKAGIRSIHYTGYGSLVKGLKALDIDTG